MKAEGEEFRSNTLMILIPGIFFGVALILRGNESLSVIIWVLLALGAITTIAVVMSFTTIVITERELRVKNMKKSHVINVNDILQKNQKVSKSKGMESIVWKLHLKNSEIVTISSSLFKEPQKLKESINSFLKGVPKINQRP